MASRSGAVEETATKDGLFSEGHYSGCRGCENNGLHETYTPAVHSRQRLAGNISCGQRQQSLTGFVPPTEVQGKSPWPAWAEVFMTDGVAVSFAIVLLLAQSDFLSILSRVEKNG